MKAIPHVLSKISDIRFFIIGKGELINELKAAAADLGLKRELIFTGFRKDVAAFYQMTAILLIA